MYISQYLNPIKILLSYMEPVFVFDLAYDLS